MKINNGKFKEGHIPWNNGKKLSEETKEKIRNTLTRRKLLEEHKKICQKF